MKDIMSFFAESFLFRGISHDELEILMKQIQVEVEEFERSTVIFSPDTFYNKIGFLISGECSVIQKHGSAVVNLKSIMPSESFGILTVFSDNKDYPTHIIAKKRSRVAFITANNIMKLIEINPKVSLNIIKFLSDRITFLNKKIDTYSSVTVEDKLASYLLTVSNNGEISEIPFNKAAAAHAISAGRASLYRALHSLAAIGAIRQNGKNIIILDYKKLERLQK